MNKHSTQERFIVEPAKASDSAQMLALYEEESAPGNPSMIFTRRDNAFFSMSQEGEHVNVLTCKDSTTKELVGFGAYSINRCYVNKKIQPVAYLFGLRCCKKFRHKAGRMIPIMYECIRLELSALGVDCVFTTILSDNAAAQRLLLRPHSTMPSYIPLGRFDIFAFRPKSLMAKRIIQGVTVQKACNFSRTRLEEFFNSEGKNRNFFPVLDDSSAYPVDFFNECLVVSDKSTGTILATGMCWDQRPFKQYIVSQYHGVYNLIRHGGPFLTWCGFPPLPAPGTILNFCTLSFVLVREERNDYFQMLLDAAAHMCTQYDYLLVGAGSHHPHLPQLLKRKHWVYTSNVYGVQWQKENGVTNEYGIPTYLECGRL